MAFVFDLGERPNLPIVGGDDRYPVRRIYCVGRNYAEHIREMGMDERDPPFFFAKPADTLVQDGGTMPYPPATSNLHHEIELVVAIGKSGANIATSAANGHVYGYAVGIDMTRRDVQLAARDKGRPWDMGKGFDHSAPCGPIYRAADIGHPTSGAITLTVNGEIRQSSDLDKLIWSVEEVIAHLSALVTLEPGDLIYTGTPAGVGPVVKGDVMKGAIDGMGDLTITVG